VWLIQKIGAVTGRGFRVLVDRNHESLDVLVPMSRLPDQIDAPMTPRQLATLRSLSFEAYQPRLFEPNLTAKEDRDDGCWPGFDMP